MTREDVHKNVPKWIDEKEDASDKSHYGKIELHRDIDRVINYVRNENQTVSDVNEILLKQLIRRIETSKQAENTTMASEKYVEGRNDMIDELISWIDKTFKKEKDVN